MSKYRISIEFEISDEEKELEKKIAWYTKLCKQHMDLIMKNQDWKPEYEQELSKLQEQLAAEKKQIDELIERIRRVSRT